MNHFSDKELLSIWEFGVNHSVLETNLFLLSHAYPEFNLNQIMSLPIGERDARLLQIREHQFGTLFHNTSNCSACGQKMEWETPIDQLKLQKIKNEFEVESIELEEGNHLLSFRLPNSHDVMEVISLNAREEKVDLLLQKCILKSSTLISDSASMNPELKLRMIAEMEARDPQANIVMNLKCAECENEWSITFDIMQYLWSEINEWAIQLMKDIYLLAKNFSWSESQILGMSRFRRNLFVNMLNR